MELKDSRLRSRSGNQLAESGNSTDSNSSECGGIIKGSTCTNNNEHPYLKGDRANVFILVFLYLLQGIPLGLSAALPIVLQNRHITYEEQAEFSFVSWPFSLKLLWAPIVDSLFWAKFGRRKSWLIPVQYLLGIGMIIISRYADEWIGDVNGPHRPNIKFLTISFICTNFLAATQDIAVDGWALTMLQRRNVGHASTCNTVGQTAGYFLGYVVFVALLSPDFCNKWFRSSPQPIGLVTFSEFVYFWGVVFLICTTLLAIFKSDKCPYAASEEGSPHLNIRQSYELLIDIFKLPTIRIMTVLLLTCKIGFSACDSVSPLKLIEAGISSEKIALIGVPLIPLQIILPFVISKFIVGQRPLDAFMNVIPYRLLIGLVVALVVFVTPYIITKDHIPIYYYGMLLLVYGFHQMMLYCMFVSVLAFFAKVSDPRSGGTYMTLLNTMSNMGNAWPGTVCLWLVDKLTWTGYCKIDKCDPITSSSCTRPCTKLDGFYVETILCTIIGIVWLRKAARKINWLQNLDESAWKVRSRLVAGN